MESPVSTNSKMPTAVLFVDDDVALLGGLQRMLRPLKAEFALEVANGGAQALELLGQRCFDVIVSDMKMPGLDGAALLSRVRSICPSTVRLVLSGQAEEEAVLRALRCTHQYLPKPCDAQDLVRRIREACSLRGRLQQRNLVSLLSGLSAAPCYSAHLEALRTELSKDNATAHAVTQIISADAAMSAKLLQLVSSAFFGSAPQAPTISQAVDFVGLEVLKRLTFEHEIFKAVPGLETRLPLSEVWGIGDLGRQLLAALCPEDYARVNERIATLSESRDRAEREIFGVHHYELGDYLLSLWGCGAAKRFPEHQSEAA